MKRTVLLLVLVGLALGCRAQGCGVDTLDWNERPRTSLWVGVAGGLSLHLMDDSPYASSHGYMLQIPLLLSYDISPRWRVSTGLRYDFNWDPLKYRVSSGYDAEGNRTPLAIDMGSHSGRQTAYAFRSYIGVPVSVTWYPVARERGLLSLSLDLFAAYAVNSYVNIRETTVNGYDPNTLAINVSSDSEVYRSDSMLPWKLEVGLTVSTDALGLLHGVRFYGNLLPTYLEPSSGTKIYQAGMTFFL